MCADISSPNSTLNTEVLEVYLAPLEAPRWNFKMIHYQRAQGVDKSSQVCRNLHELVRKEVVLGLRTGNKSVGSVQETLGGEVSKL